jgi:glycosyltransferase involved in cell wall biosynthesis
MHPRITVGIPVYRGEQLVRDALQSIVAQTFRNFRVLLSVDGGDHASALACQSFLSDRRFSLVMQDQTLGWAGNINWITKQVDTEFFVYMSQDDMIAPSYYETLLKCADHHRDASIFYSDVAWIGGKSGIMQQPEKTGSAFERVISQLQDCLWFPFVGLRRSELLTKVDDLLVDQADSALEDVIWVTRALQITDVKRVAEPLFYKRFHPGMVTVGKSKWPREYARTVWVDAWSRMLAAALPAAHGHEAIKAMLLVALKRVAVSAPDMDWFYKVDHLGLGERQRLVADFLNHLETSGTALSAHLDEAPAKTLAWALAAVFGELQVGATPEPGAPRRFRLDPMIVGSGWHQLEQHQRWGTFRWTGPGLTSNLHMPFVLDRDYRVRVHIPFSVADLPHPRIELFSNHGPLDVVVTSGSNRSLTMEALVRAQDPAAKEMLDIKLGTDRTVRPTDVSDSSDTRALGVPVDWIEVEPNSP